MTEAELGGARVQRAERKRWAVCEVAEGQALVNCKYTKSYGVSLVTV